jgi:transposase
VRGKTDFQGHLFVYLKIDDMVPAEHPLRIIKKIADGLLAQLSGDFGKHFSSIGRPSVPPERLLKAWLLIALYSVRSDRMFCEMLQYNLLFRWFLDMNIDDETFDPSSFTRLRDRFLSTGLAQLFFESIVFTCDNLGLLSSEHFTVDGSLLEAWASHKSFQPKKPEENVSEPKDDSEMVTGASVQSDVAKTPNEPGKQTDKLQKDEMVDFKGQKRCNDTHQSTTDGDARLMRKGPGKEAKLCYGGHVLMENRNGLLMDIQVALATTTETSMAKTLLERAIELGFDPQTLGADKGYHTKDFVQFLRDHGIAPHIAQITGRKTPGLDGRTTRHDGYAISQKVRKRVEEIFGWAKSFGGLRKARFVGLPKNQFSAYIVGAAYNLVRLSNLLSAA